MNDDDANKTLAQLSLSDHADEIFMRWFQSRQPFLNDIFAWLKQALNRRDSSDEKKMAVVVRVRAGFGDVDSRDLLWEVKPEEREAVWGSGKRVVCDDARLVELAREDDLVKFIKNSWVPVTKTSRQRLTL
jgi:hypothetical protein